MGLIQRMAEESGIPTISMGNMPDRMGYIKPPRALLVKFPRGSMLGEPGNAQRQRRIPFKKNLFTPNDISRYIQAQ